MPSKKLKLNGKKRAVSYSDEDFNKSFKYVFNVTLPIVKTFYSGVYATLYDKLNEQGRQRLLHFDDLHTHCTGEMSTTISVRNKYGDKKPQSTFLAVRVDTDNCDDYSKKETCQAKVSLTRISRESINPKRLTASLEIIASVLEDPETYKNLK